MQYLSEAQLNAFLAEVDGYPADVKKGNWKLQLKKLHRPLHYIERNGDALTRYMKMTYKIRRHEVSLKLGVGRIVKHFPGLRCYDQIRREFNRITEANVRLFEVNVRKLVWGNNPDGIIDFDNHTLRMFILAHHNNAMGKALFDFAFEEEDEIPVLKNLERTAPTIIVRSDAPTIACCSVFCENERIISGLSFYKAFLVSYYLHHVFSIDKAPADAEMWQMLDTVLQMTPRSLSYR